MFKHTVSVVLCWTSACYDVWLRGFDSFELAMLPRQCLEVVCLDSPLGNYRIIPTPCYWSLVDLSLLFHELCFIVFNVKSSLMVVNSDIKGYSSSLRGP